MIDFVDLSPESVNNVMQYMYAFFTGMATAPKMQIV